MLTFIFVMIVVIPVALLLLFGVLFYAWPEFGGFLVAVSFLYLLGSC
jgi:hypothetical protein